MSTTIAPPECTVHCWHPTGLSVVQTLSRRLLMTRYPDATRGKSKRLVTRRVTRKEPQP